MTAKEEKPIRIQRKRSKGWRIPENTVYVGRPTVYGSQFYIGIHGTREECVKHFEEYMTPENMPEDVRKLWKNHLKKIKGKNLACWCRLDQPCHADILLRIANEK